MSKKKAKKNTTLEILNKINILNRRINKQRKSVINNLKTSLDSIGDSVLKNESETLDKLERDRNILNNKLKK